MRFLLVIIIAACVHFPAFSQVYKWVDDKGVTQYGDQSAANSKAQKIKMDGGSTAGSTATVKSAGSPASLNEKDAEFRKRRILKNEEEEKETNNKAARNKACMQAKDQLEVIRRANRIYNLNSKGERVYQNDADRDASKTKFEAAYNQHCN